MSRGTTPCLTSLVCSPSRRTLRIVVGTCRTASSFKGDVHGAGQQKTVKLCGFGAFAFPLPLAIWVLHPSIHQHVQNSKLPEMTKDHHQPDVTAVAYEREINRTSTQEIASQRPWIYQLPLPLTAPESHESPPFAAPVSHESPPLAAPDSQDSPPLAAPVSKPASPAPPSPKPALPPPSPPSAPSAPSASSGTRGLVQRLL